MSSQARVSDMIRDMGSSIAQAQFALDTISIQIAKKLGDDDSRVELSGRSVSLLELGFSPTFYQISEATVEAKVSFTTSSEQGLSVSASLGVNVGFFAASVNAEYSQKYSYSATGSSSITARFVSVPPPTTFTEALNRARLEPSTSETE